jgi:hypothetical protein
VSAWVYLATAPDQITGEIWVAILRDAGIAARLRPSDTASFLGVSALGCRVQVQEEDAERAREVLGEQDQPEDNGP